jgi:hypothetical protein
MHVRAVCVLCQRALTAHPPPPAPAPVRNARRGRYDVGVMTHCGRDVDRLCATAKTQLHRNASVLKCLVENYGKTGAWARARARARAGVGVRVRVCECVGGCRQAWGPLEGAGVWCRHGAHPDTPCRSLPRARQP